jgi:cysteine-S-conjugate beta-lyase
MNDTFDFDTPIDRSATSSSKWNRYAGRDIIPLWVADMDFRCARPIVEALRERVEHGLFGYTDPPAELAPAIAHALERDYGWRIDHDWLVWMPSLVVGLNVVSRAFAHEGEDLVTAIPIYPPFLSAPANANRNAIRVMLREVDTAPSPPPSPSRGEEEQPGVRAPIGSIDPAAAPSSRPSPPPVEKEHNDAQRPQSRWEWDFDALERSAGPRTRVLMLCSPHNPTGRVWSRDELQQLAAFAQRRDLIVVSDEIHCGLVLDEHKRHIPFATLSEDAAARTVTLMSASKTFNTPTLGCAFAIASNPNLRARLKRAMAGIVHHVGGLGFTATLAAYRDGRAWQLALLEYLRGNRDLVERALSAMPGLRTWHVEGTYLAWIDARGLDVPNPFKFFEDAGVGLYEGALFGTPGFLRLNFACPRSVLTEALRRMGDACRSIASARSSGVASQAGGQRPS